MYEYSTFLELTSTFLYINAEIFVSMRPTRAEINLTILHSNLKNIRHKLAVNTQVMGIVKANAYGHGLVEISKSLVQNGIEYLGVGFIEEGIQLRTAGITSPILVLGGVFGDQVEKFLAFDFEITVSSLELAQRINDEVAKNNGRKARVHMKIDTGMERLGIHSEHAVEFVEKVARLPKLDIVGIFSHFASSEKDTSFTQYQLQQFTSVLEQLKKKKIEIPFKHIANSGAILNGSESYFNLARPGILLYGIYPSKEIQKTISVIPILSLKSKIVYLKDVAANKSISYGRTYFTNRTSRIATIPIGYGDGYFRTLSNNVDVLIHGKRFSSVGTICMDQMMLDVTDGENIHVGDDVTLIGKDGNEEIKVEELAEKVGTNSYEVLTNISTRVPRFFFT